MHSVGIKDETYKRRPSGCYDVKGKEVRHSVG